MFIDEAKIRVKAGDGGNGCMAFRREKFVPRGGPSGGDGGKGGDVVMESSERHNTLVHFRFNPEHKADRGHHGEGSNKTGRDGGDVVLKVPVGTIGNIRQYVAQDTPEGLPAYTYLAVREVKIVINDSLSLVAGAADAETHDSQRRFTRRLASTRLAGRGKSTRIVWS